MRLKKLVSGIAALAVASSAFAGLAVTASAATELEDFHAASANYYGTFESDSDYNTEEYYVQIYKNVLYCMEKQQEMVNLHCRILLQL